MDKLNKNTQTTRRTTKDVPSAEKRKHPRCSVELPLDYSRPNGKEIYGGIVANASEGGILVYLPERLEIGAVLKIDIMYTQGLELNSIKAVAKIVWGDLTTRETLKEHHYGLQFQYMDEADFGRLISLLKEVRK